jgi:D-alanyl-D-alanine dipeptidase
MPLVEITPATHGVDIDLAYATSDNFTGAAIYGRAACYLHPDAEACLRRAVDLAAVHGLSLRLFDAFRPAEAQWTLWRHTPDPEFVADPRRGSPHSRGVAVDLTLVDGAGRALDMGTGFDDFTPRAHHGCRAVGAQAQHNRTLLLGLMTAAGWDFYRYEWWHYQLFASRAYPLLSDSALARPMMAA